MTISKNQNLTPSICKIEFASFADVYSILVGTTPYSREVVFKSGKDWEELYFTSGTAELEEKEKSSEAGVFYDQILSFLFPGDDTTTLSDFGNYGNKRFIVKFTYCNADIRLLGDILNPARLNIDFSLNDAGYKCSFQREGKEKAYLLE
jgi:hypothetical protein